MFLLLSGLAMCALVAGTHGILLAALCFWVLDAALAWRRPGVLFDNVLGTLATATIVQEALALVFAKRPILNSVSLGFTDRNGSPIAQFGQQVITRTFGIPSVVDFGSAASARADVDVPVTLNQFKQLRYEFTPQQYSGTNRDLIAESAEPMAVALANFMVDAIGALWTIGNFPARTGADAVANGATSTKTAVASGWDYSHLVDVRSTINKAGVPQFRRFYVGNSDVYGSLLNDPRIVAALYNPQNMDAIKTGKLPNVAGFDIDEYPNLPTTGNLVGFAGTPDSTVYAQRVPRDPREVLKGAPFPGNIGIVSEPRTGLSVMVTEHINVDTLVAVTRLIWMYGVAPGNPNNGQLIVTQ